MFSVRAQSRLGWGGTARALVLTTGNRAAPAPPLHALVQRSLLQPHHITFSWTAGDDGYAPLRLHSLLLVLHVLTTDNPPLLDICGLVGLRDFV